VPEWPRFVIGMRKTMLASRHADAAKFIAGYIEGLTYAMSHRDETIALGAKVTKLPPASLIFAAAFDEVKQGNYVSVTAEIPVDKIKWLQDVLVKAKKLSKPLDTTLYVDQTVRTDALKLVKR